MSSTSPDGFRRHADQVSAAAPLGADRVLYWPLILSVLYPVAFVLSWSGPFNVTFVALPLVMLLWALSAVVGVVATAEFGFRRAWRQAISSAIFPLATLLVVLNYEFAAGMLATAGDELHVAVMRGSYHRQISTFPAGERRLVAFDWGGFGSITHAVIYDDSDEIALPIAQRSSGWKGRAEGTLAACALLGLAPAGSHFYIVRLEC